MKSRWVDSFRRGLAPSPRGQRSPLPLPLPGAASQTHTSSTRSSVSGGNGENPAFVHHAARCESAGGCSVAHVLENCVLQGGVHHTHMHVLTYLGRPLRSECCCYPVAVQWFRAVGEQDDFQAISGACDEWYTPTADDIGARILAKVMIEDEDVLKTKMLEYGPIKEDPEVRSKVEMYLERKSVLFMGLQSISVQDGSEYPNSEELRESWTLLIDDRRVRLTCESSLIPPFESLYTPDIKLEVVHGTPNEFYLHLAEGCYVRLRAESNTVRDIIILTLRAFCKVAISNDMVSDAVARGDSPMLTLRTLAQLEEAEAKTRTEKALQPPPAATAPAARDASAPTTTTTFTAPAPAYDLPWNPRSSSGPDPGDFTVGSSKVEELDGSLDGRLSRTSSIAFSGGASARGDEELDDSLLLDAEALIGNAMKMGVQYQVPPRAPKRISVQEVADLQIIEAQDVSSEGRQSTWRAADKKDTRGHVAGQEKRSKRRQRPRHRSLGIGSDCSTPPGSVGDSNSDESGSDEDAGTADGSGAMPFSLLDASCIDEAIEDFMAEAGDGNTRVKKNQADVTALRERYVAIFCALQRQLHTYKQRALTLSKQLEEKQELNASFRTDIDALRSALTSMQVTDKVYDLVTTDLRQLAKRTATADIAQPFPPNFY